MRIPCPFCGERDVHEFVCRGEAGPERPSPDGEGAEARFVEYVYSRENPCGPDREHWYHASGCRRWLVVDRDTRTHAILGVSLAGVAGA